LWFDFLAALDFNTDTLVAETLFRYGACLKFMIAVIETGGKQYKVAVGDKVKIEKLSGEAGAAVAFDKILLVADGDSAKIGQPYVSGASVTANILEQGRDKKKIVFRYHSKTRYRKKKGHRQHFTEVQIENIK